MSRLRWEPQPDGNERAEFGPWVFEIWPIVRMAKGWRWTADWPADAGGVRAILAGDLVTGHGSDQDDREAARAAAEAKLAEWLGEIDAASGADPLLDGCLGLDACECIRRRRDHEAMQALRRLQAQGATVEPYSRGWEAYGRDEQRRPIPSEAADDPADAILALARRLGASGAGGGTDAD